MDYIPYGELESFVRLVGYPGLFAAVFAETGIFFMFFLPGSSMLFTAGLLASHGLFNVWLLLPLITLAAILGDSTGYWFGTKVGPALFKREDSRFFKKSHVEQTRLFYEKHGVIAIVLARFVPIVRTFAPTIAGMGGMEYRKFLFYNVFGGVGWVASMTLTCYFLGRTIPNVEKHIHIIIAAVIFISLIPIMKEWIQHRFAKKAAAES